MKRLIVLPEDLNKKLSKEPNASSLVAKLLEAYYERGESVQKLVKLVEDFEDEDFDLRPIERQLKQLNLKLDQLLQLTGRYQ